MKLTCGGLQLVVGSNPTSGVTTLRGGISRPAFSVELKIPPLLATYEVFL